MVLQSIQEIGNSCDASTFWSKTFVFTDCAPARLTALFALLLLKHVVEKGEYTLWKPVLSVSLIVAVVHNHDTTAQPCKAHDPPVTEKT